MRKAWLAAGCLGLASLFMAEGAEAQSSSRIPDTNWRKRDRGGVDGKRSPQRFAFELRFGAYTPAIDDEFGGSATPYRDFFGDGMLFHFGAEFDWQAVRIPYVGTLGPGVGFGYVSTSAEAYLVNTYGTSAPERAGSTSLTILPMYVSAVVRFDELMRRTGVPIVPYGKVGLGAGLWWVNTGDKGSKVGDGDTAILGRGTSLGIHWALGGMLALDWLGQRSMASLDQETGINHVYLFGEWMNQNLGLFGDSMRVGTSTWMVGLTMEM